MPVTLRDVAKLAGTSVSAASTVLSGTTTTSVRVSVATRERILAAARELGYQPNQLARGLVRRRSNVLIASFPYVAAFYDLSPFNMQLLGGIIDGVRHAGQNLMLHTAGAPDQDQPDPNSLTDQRADGAIVILPREGEEALTRCETAQYPHIAVCCRPELARRSINADDLEAGRMATRHLIELGHRRIGHLIGTPGYGTAELRLEGYRSALREVGLASRTEWEIPSAFHWEHGLSAGRELLALPAEIRPTAVFASNDTCADGFYRACREVGVRIPDDMSVVGCDDTWYCQLLSPPLTSVHLPIYTMGYRAVEILNGLIAGTDPEHPHLRLAPTFTVRGSTAPRQA